MECQVQRNVAGLCDDFANLLNEFADLNSVEYKDFASIWRKQNFSLVFRDLCDEEDIYELTSEVFCISTQYLLSSSYYQQIGAVFLLHAIYQREILKSSIWIPLELNHFKVIKSLHNDAILKKYQTLHYVIDYLMKHAFHYQSCQTLKGPLTLDIQTVPKSDDPSVELKANYNSEFLKYTKTTGLTDLLNLHSKYIDVQMIVRRSDVAATNQTYKFYEKGLNKISQLLNPVNSRRKRANVGQRRAKIKSECFKRQSKDRLGNTSSSDQEIQAKQDSKNESSTEQGPRTRRARRTPKHERRVGRPRKYPKKESPSEASSGDDVDIDHLVYQQKDFFLPHVNDDQNCRTKRDYYFQLSPKREESDSE